MATIQCPQCGTTFDDSEKFCTNNMCGYPAEFAKRPEDGESTEAGMPRRPGDQVTVPVPPVRAPVAAPLPVVRPVQPSSAKPSDPPRKLPFGPILGAIVVVVVILGLVAFLMSRGQEEAAGGSGSGTASASPVGGPSLTTQGFVTPSGNIRCDAFDSTILCVIESGLVPEPAGNCPANWIGVAIRAGSFAGPVCSEDPGVGSSELPTLEYGEVWTRGDITCDSESTRLRCIDTSGNGFTLARAGWELLA
jgi:hypothetical protein